MRMNWIVVPLLAASLVLIVWPLSGAYAQPAGGGAAPVGSTTTTTAPPTAQITDNITGTTSSMPIDQTGLTIGPPPQDITIVHTPKGYCGKTDPGGMNLGFDEKTGTLVGMFTKRPPSDPKSAFNPWKGPDPLPPGMPPCPKPTLVMNIPKVAPATTGGVKAHALMPDWTFQYGLGGTVLVPHVNFNYLGTGVGPGVSTSIDTPKFLPTLEVDIRHPIGNGMALGLSGNFEFPLSGSSSKSVTANVPGTLSYTQGLSMSAYANYLYEFCWWDAEDEDDYEDCLDWADRKVGGLQLRMILGIGLAADQWKASESFPGNGDNFSTGWQTTVEPSFQAGISFRTPYTGYGWTQLLVTDTLGSGTKTMPGGNALSYGTAKFGNNVGVTLKYVLPFGDP